MGTNEPAFSYTHEYQVGSGAIDLGREYEHKMVALISLRCLLQDFDDIQIAFNAAGLGALDDVVVMVKTNQGKTMKILMQLKHEVQGKSLVREQFLASKGNYSLPKYCDCIIKLRRCFDCKSEQKGIIKDLNTFDDLCFVLFTNKPTNQHEFLENNGWDDISFLNTAANNDNLYKFDLGNIPELSSLPDLNYNVFLFAKQNHVNGLDEIIENEMEKVFQHFEIRLCNSKIITKAYMEYVTDWSLGKLGNHYYLTKQDILYKLTELFLSQYELDLRGEKLEFYDCPRKSLWNEIVRDKIITVVDSDEEIIKFLKLYIGSEIRQYCPNVGQMWCFKFQNAEQSLFYKDYRNLKKGMLKIIGNNGRISLLSIFKCLWFNERLPLLLKINTLETFTCILKILKVSDYKLKVIILNASNLKLNTSDSIPGYFTKLSNLNFEHNLKILNCSVKLQGRSFLILKEIIYDSLYEYINCNAIISILMGNFNVGVLYEPLSEYFIERCLLKVFLKIAVLKEINNEIFVIETNKDNSIRSKLEKLISKFRNKPNINIWDEQNSIRVQELKREEKPIHRLVFHNDSLLEWKESFGNVSNIRKYGISHEVDFKEYLFSVKCSPHDDINWLYNKMEDILSIKRKNWFNCVNVVSASPGMGKSTILDYIAATASTEMWVLNMELGDYDDYYEEISSQKENLTAQDHLKYFNNTILAKHGCNNMQLVQAVFQRFVDKGQVLVLLDGLDEVSISYKNDVVKISNCLHKAGFSVWVTTRPHLARELEEKFSTISTTLKPFTSLDQKLFLNKYFQRITDTANDNSNKHQIIIEEFVEKLLQACRNNLNDPFDQFMGVPLQTKLLANAFSSELKASLCTGTVKFESRFDLVYLYEEFMKRKDNILRDKFGRGAKDMKKLFQIHQQLFALKLIFDTESLFRLDIKQKLMDYYNNNEDQIQFLQQDGVTVIQRRQITFVHRTFAEYLAACWLFNNFNSESVNLRLTARHLLLQRCRGHTNYGVLFKMFDFMLAGNSALLKLIINARFDDARELIKSNPGVMNFIDRGGRTFLHIIALYGTDSQYKFPKPRVINRILDFLNIIPDANIKNIKDFLGYTALDYALLNSSFTIADKLCEKLNKLTVSTNMLHLHDIYIENTWLMDYKYKTLLKVILPLHICQKLLTDSQSLNHDSTIACYCINLFKYSNNFNEIINEYTKESGIKTIFELLGKMNFKSADPEPYYYDLSFAVTFGTLPNVLDLILSEYYPSVPKQSISSYTALYWAIRHNRLEIIKILLFYNENVNELCRWDLTPLHCAARNGYTDIISLLLSYRANVDAQDVYGDTPLIVAIYNNHIETVKLLISNKANVKIKNRHNFYPVFYAASRGHVDIIPDLSKGVNVNSPGLYGDLPLFKAITNGHINTVRSLLDNGADCNIAIKSQLPLHACAQEGLYEILPEIVAKTLENNHVKAVNLKTNVGETPLHLTISGKWTGLFNSRSSNRSKIVNFLLNNGADVNIQSGYGNTALHFLCQDCPLDRDDKKLIAALLVEKGADINLKNRDGHTPSLLLLHYLASEDNPGCELKILPLLVHENNVNLQDIKGNTVLHCLFKESDISTDERKIAARLVLSNGADVNIKNNISDTALHLFLRYLFTCDLIRQLFEIFPLMIHKANVNLQDIDGNTALHYFCIKYISKKIDRKSAVVLLLEKGADVNLKNNLGESVREFAICHQLTDIISLFQEKSLKCTLKDHTMQ